MRFFLTSLLLLCLLPKSFADCPDICTAQRNINPTPVQVGVNPDGSISIAGAVFVLGALTTRWGIPNMIVGVMEANPPVWNLTNCRGEYMLRLPPNTQEFTLYAFDSQYTTDGYYDRLVVKLGLVYAYVPSLTWTFNVASLSKFSLLAQVDIQMFSKASMDLFFNSPISKFACLLLTGSDQLVMSGKQEFDTAACGVLATIGAYNKTLCSNLQGGTEGDWSHGTAVGSTMSMTSSDTSGAAVIPDPIYVGVRAGKTNFCAKGNGNSVSPDGGVAWPGVTRQDAPYFVTGKPPDSWPVDAPFQLGPDVQAKIKCPTLSTLNGVLSALQQQINTDPRTPDGQPFHTIQVPPAEQFLVNSVMRGGMAVRARAV
jgi:hypothetical protein